MLLHVRKVVYTVSFLMLLVWNLYCVVNALISKPIYGSYGENDSLVIHGLYFLSNLLATGALINWFLPTVGLGVIAIVAKPSE